MFLHEYTGRDTFGNRETRTGLNTVPFIILLFYAVLVTIIICIITSDRNDLKARDLQWSRAYADVEAQKGQALDTGAQLLMKYENLACETRGLVVTTVKSITLCMNPETKALHKIDKNAD